MHRTVLRKVSHRAGRSKHKPPHRGEAAATLSLHKLASLTHCPRPCLVTFSGHSILLIDVHIMFGMGRAGRSVLLLEQFDFLHRRGSSHGDSRITRKTYMQDHYVRLMQEAYPAWDDIERRSGVRLYTKVLVAAGVCCFSPATPCPSPLLPCGRHSAEPLVSCTPLLADGWHGRNSSGIQAA